ncbi:hypothetical protein K7432_009175 [Basidiobolus ranarum]|uniref:Arrestin C-terminal-like domain-containing protein n=1 Tax=Basidiobolus ranarum TaxID=34480 RepID=A0ABR2WQM5_9FUNG
MNTIRPKATSIQLRTLSNTVLVHEDYPDSFLHVSLDLKLHKSLKVHSIYLVLNGIYTRVRLSGLWKEKITRCTSHCNILERQGTEYYLGPGEYSYNCVVKIPNHTDQTTTTDIGKVEYQLHGVVETMKFHPNLTKTVPVYVHRVLPRCEELELADGLWEDMLRYQVMSNGIDYTLEDSLNIAFRLESLVDVSFPWKLTATLKESVGYYSRLKNGNAELKKRNRTISKVTKYKPEEPHISWATLNLPVNTSNTTVSYDCHGQYVSVSHHIEAKIEMVNDKRRKFISILPIRLIHPDVQQWLEKSDSTHLPRYSSLPTNPRATYMAQSTLK